jgi:hypothetical protein
LETKSVAPLAVPVTEPLKVPVALTTVSETQLPALQTPASQAQSVPSTTGTQLCAEEGSQISQGLSGEVVPAANTLPSKPQSPPPAALLLPLLLLPLVDAAVEEAVLPLLEVVTLEGEQPASTAAATHQLALMAIAPPKQIHVSH